MKTFEILKTPNSVVYLEPSQSSTMELFCENSSSFSQTAASYMFDWVLNAPLQLALPTFHSSSTRGFREGNRRQNVFIHLFIYFPIFLSFHTCYKNFSELHQNLVDPIDFDLNSKRQIIFWR